MRFDAARAAQRAIQAAPPASEVGTNASAPQLWGVVHGSDSPELLLPGELFRSLLKGLSTNTKARDIARAMWHGRLIGAGIEPDRFWFELETLIPTYLGAAARHHEIILRTAEATDAERRELSAQADSAGRELCGLRASALAMAREHFGGETFDRILYTVVAPGMTLAIDTPSAGTPEHLRFLERGCR